VSDPKTVGNEEFRRQMGPMIGALRALANAVEAVGERHGDTPAADSQAMAELAGEAKYAERSDGWEAPVSEAHTMGSVVLRAATDAVRTFAATFAGAEQPPLYGHLVIARAALQASVVASWLSEPDIAFEERVKRALCESLYSQKELKRVASSPHVEKTLVQIKGWADALGWEYKFDGRVPVIEGTRRPSMSDGLRRLLVSAEEDQLGHLLWSRLSAVDHALWWGLVWAFHLDDVDTSGSGFATVAVGANSSKVALQAYAILRSLRCAAADRIELMGWSDDEWSEAVSPARQQERKLLEHAAAGL
jgi:hypothetical protein